jgi:flagellar basal-body rod protein FlgB
MADAALANVALFDLAEQRLGWLDARQRVVAQNIANADTPSFVARDMVPFEKYLSRSILVPERTSPLHLAGLTRPLASAQTRPMERAPDGNTVSVEDELTHVADNETQQGLVGNIWKTYMGMFMTVLGK